MDKFLYAVDVLLIFLDIFITDACEIPFIDVFVHLLHIIYDFFCVRCVFRLWNNIRMVHDVFVSSKIDEHGSCKEKRAHKIDDAVFEFSILAKTILD